MTHDPPMSMGVDDRLPAMASLFDLCVEVVLQSPSLSEKAALHLPQRISQYVLYEACHGKKFVAVEKLVEAWPHPTLSFDFLSFPLCRQRRESSKSCLLAPEYFNVDSNNELSPCITSITVGVFKNVQRQVYHRDPGNQLQVVDMSHICAGVDNVTSLKRLVAGEFPGTHATDYLSSKDRQSHAAVRPRLPLPHSTSRQIKVLLSLILNRTTSLEPFSSEHCIGHFKVVITGLQLLSLRHKPALTAQLENLLVCNSTLQYIKIDPSLIDIKSVTLLPVLSPSAILSFIVPSELEKEEKYVRIFAHLFQSISLVNALFINSFDERIFNALLSVDHCKVRALGVVQPTLSRNESHTNLVLVKFLQHNSKSIEYLQLRPYFLTTVLTPLLTQLQCSNLRVLSIDSCGQSSREKEFHLGVDIFNSLCDLHSLEFLEWSEVINLRTTDIMALYHLLSSGLPKLRHWHMYLNKLLLSTTDLQSSLYFSLLPLLEPLLTGKVGDESCTTYMFPFSHTAFINWLQSLRDDVCFRTGSHRDCPSAQLCNLFPWLGYY